MYWGPESGLSILLLHNAMAIIVAFLLCQIFSYRVLVALLATGAALTATYLLRDLTLAHRIGWWALVKAPFESAALKPDRHAILSFTILIGVLAPFVFSYLTACRWTAGQSRQPLSLRRMRLKSIVAATTLTALIFGYHRWLESHNIAYYPTLLLAVILMIRPVRLFLSWRDDERYGRRLVRSSRETPADEPPN